MPANLASDTNKKIIIAKSVLSVVIGLMCIGSAVAAYCFPPVALSEYCFIVNLSAGIAFLFGSIYSLVKKAVPTTIYFACMIALLIMFVATLVFRLNINGAFAFVHIINPIAIFLYWCIFCNHTKLLKKSIFIVLVFPLAYFVFTLAHRAVAGQFPFPISVVAAFGDLYVAAFVPVMVIVLLGIGWVFDALNRKICKWANN